MEVVEMSYLKEYEAGKRGRAHDVRDNLIEQLRGELAAAQADNARLREGLEYAMKQVPELGTVPGISNALSTLSDDTALREWGARLSGEWAGDNEYGIDDGAAALRSGEWTPECLK